jgi:hypothetical protein
VVSTTSIYDKPNFLTKSKRFLVMFVVMIGLSFGTVLGYPTLLTWWALIIALVISAVWMIPIGMIQAITNIQIGLNVFTGK